MWNNGDFTVRLLSFLLTYYVGLAYLLGAQVMN